MNRLAAALLLAVNCTSALAIEPGERVIVLNSGEGTVSVIDVADSVTTGDPITVGSTPSSIAFNSDGSKAYVANRGSDSVSVIDVASRKTLSPITVGSEPTSVAVSVDGTALYVANSLGNSVSVINVQTSAVSTILVGSHPRAVAFSPDGTTAYVTNSWDNTVSVIDVRTATITGTPITVGQSPVAVAVSPDGSMVYTANENGGNVSVITVATKAVASLNSIGSYPSSVAFRPNGAQAYVTTYEGIRVIEIDPALTPPIVQKSSSVVSASVAPGPLTASLSAVEFAAVPFSHAAQSVSTSATLAADDQTGLLYGWNVTLLASTLVWTSPGSSVDANRNIAASALSVAAVTGVDTLAGDAFVGIFGGRAALDSAVSVVSTSASEGSGSYSVPLALALAVPANAASGRYVGTLTTTISAAP